MSRRMLINAIHPEETRIAVADEDHLVELEIERANTAQLRGNVYKAEITRVEPSLQAAFLDIGSERNGFLQINDINPTYFSEWNGEKGRRNRPAIQDVLQKGQSLVVQVVKDSRDAKGATLTTNLSLPGRYLVLMVGNQRGGVSRKIVDESQRHKLKQSIERLKIPAGMGAIVRTAGINKTYEELNRDLEGSLELWYDILRRAAEPGSPKVLYQESGLAIRTIRDYASHDIEEILIDHQETYEQAKTFVDKIMPQYASRLKFYDEPRPLFARYHLDRQVDAIGQPEVTLPSGGSIVINVTEAIVAVDVNSGRSTGQSDVEETAFNTNKEAVVEIAKQLRLRDLGGLVVIDLIDMWDKRHKHVVEKTLKDSVRTDRAKIEMGRISKFGLLEMSRQRLKASLVSQSHIKCPHCSGGGWVKTADAAALEALRKIQSSVFAGGVSQVRVRMAPAAALFLLNNKRATLAKLEEQTQTTVLIYADGRMRPDEYQFELETTSGGFRGLESPPPLQRAEGERTGHRGGDRSSSRGGDRRNDRRGDNRNNQQRNRNNDRYAGDRRGGERQGGDRQGPERQGTERQGTERQSTDRQGPDRQGPDRQSPDRQGQDRSGQDRQGNVQGNQQANQNQAGPGTPGGEQQPGEGRGDGRGRRRNNRNRNRNRDWRPDRPAGGEGGEQQSASSQPGAESQISEGGGGESRAPEAPRAERFERESSPEPSFSARPPEDS